MNVLVDTCVWSLALRRKTKAATSPEVDALSALIGDGRVSPAQRIKIIVNRERRWFPTGSRRMAHGAIRRDVERHVVRVG